MTYEQIKENEAVKTYIRQADASLGALGYTEHSFAHVGSVAEMTGYILQTMGKDARTVELGKIAGYLHDIGNLVNRVDHSRSGAIMAFRLLDRWGFPPEEISLIVTAIGNHDEGTGAPINAVAAALILADKCDVRRSRVRPQECPPKGDIHDRVNYAVMESGLTLEPAEKMATLRLTIDTEQCAVMDYFEIFLTRMMLCRRAAEYLSLRFRLIINGATML